MRFSTFWKLFGEKGEQHPHVPPKPIPPPMPEVVHPPLSEPVLSIIRTLENGEWTSYCSKGGIYCQSYEFAHKKTSLKIKVHVSVIDRGIGEKIKVLYYTDEPYMTQYEREAVGKAAMESKIKFDAIQKLERDAKRKEEFMVLIETTHSSKEN